MDVSKIKTYSIIKTFTATSSLKFKLVFIPMMLLAQEQLTVLIRVNMVA